MDFYPAIWNVLHDGSIIAVRGAVPGTVQLDVAIDYLRERFADPGEIIQVTLTDCTRFAYRDYEAQDFSIDFSAIAAIEPEVLSAEMLGGMSKVCCVGGTLEVCASGGSLALDSGRAITLQELIDVSKAYWTEWCERAKQARQTRPHPARMSFKRPYWRLMLISLGCLALGFADWMIVTPDFKAAPDWRLWVFASAYFLALFGVVGFISSLIWMLCSGFRKH